MTGRNPHQTLCQQNMRLRFIESGWVGGWASGRVVDAGWAGGAVGGQVASVGRSGGAVVAGVRKPSFHV